MILQLTALLAMASPQGVAQQPAAPTLDAGALISKAMSHYYEASSVSGQIRLTQSAKGVQLLINTALQFDQPSQISIQQSRTGSAPKQISMVSDGKSFSYDKPEGLMGQNRFREKVMQHGYSQTVRDMYSASSRALLDRSPVLDLIIGRLEDLKVLKGKWGAKKITGRTTLRGVEAVIIEGAYHDMPGAAPTGHFQMVVTEQGDILRYSNTQRYRVPDQTTETIEVLSVWEVDVKVNAKTDPVRYRVG